MENITDNVLIRLEKKLDYIIENGLLAEKKEDKILTAGEILAALNVSSYGSFLNRKEKLIEFGMFKNGHWRMRSTDLERYLNAKQK